MRHANKLIAGLIVGLAGCAPLVLAPGAEQVRVTNVSRDVVDCAPVGNLRVPKDADGLVDIAHALGQFKNQAVGLGGNVALVTEGLLKVPTAGIAYQCPVPSGTGT